MDDDLQALEAELTQLRPTLPSAALTRQLSHVLAEAPVRRSRAWWLSALALPIAAAVAFAVFTPNRPVSPTRPAQPSTAATPVSVDVLKPVAAQNLLYAAHDEGTVILDNGARARRERLNYIDTITWKNPQTHASLTWSLPREEVRVVPVRYE